MTSTDFVIGLIAGEGTFGLNTKMNKGKWYCRPYFKLTLDASDGYLVSEAREVVGGIGKIYDGRGGSVVRWEVHSKENTRKLCNIIKKYGTGPWFASKKYQSFKTWEKIIEIYCTPENATNQDRVNMAYLAYTEELNVGSGHTDANYERVIDWYDTQHDIKPTPKLL